METTVLLPAIKPLKSAEEQISTFEMIESRFTWQARVTTLLTGLSEDTYCITPTAGIDTLI